MVPCARDIQGARRGTIPLNNKKSNEKKTLSVADTQNIYKFNITTLTQVNYFAITTIQQHAVQGGKTAAEILALSNNIAKQ